MKPHSKQDGDSHSLSLQFHFFKVLESLTGFPIRRRCNASRNNNAYNNTNIPLIDPNLHPPTLGTHLHRLEDDSQVAGVVEDLVRVFEHLQHPGEPVGPSVGTTKVAREPR